ncbi:vWA domain-containing protein [Streptomyces sp. 8N706]|uniref:vWA domain-containing protein n=1 Tax=Streptomyces sp. 8N706 TaxID=3457416 RepID=UPI003FD43D27
MADNRGHLLPVYVVADESGSMSSYIGDLNAGLSSLHTALLGEPMAAAKVRFSVLGFADDVVVRMVLADLRSEDELPALSTRGRTSYAAAFDELLTRIPQDVATLKAEGYQVHRPAVFFMSDGQPNSGEDWRAPHARLTDRAVTKAAPNIIACGIGEARAETILSVATQSEFAFVSLPGSQLGPSIAKFCTALTKSVVESGRSLASGNAELVVEKPEGFRMAIDVI